MNKKLISIREKAIKIREKLSYEKTDDQRHIGKLDKIIRGTVLVKWMHLFAVVFFLIFAAFFTYLVYPDAKFMILMLSFAVGGYAVSLLGVIIQIKLYERTINKIQLLLEDS
jgi:hypothetical protein